MILKTLTKLIIFFWISFFFRLNYNSLCKLKSRMMKIRKLVQFSTDIYWTMEFTDRFKILLVSFKQKCFIIKLNMFNFRYLSSQFLQISFNFYFSIRKKITYFQMDFTGCRHFFYAFKDSLKKKLELF